MILGLLLGSLVQVLIPRRWVEKFFGGLGFGSTFAAGVAALPSMMCSCCAAPVTVGLKNRSASNNASLAYFLANIDTIPAYVLFVALLGAFRAWLFPLIGSGLSDGLLAIIVLAVTGTMFVIPTAAEIPIVQSLMILGLGVGPAATLLVTLPAVSLPSLLIIKRAFSTKVLAFLAASVALVGVAAGIIAPIVF